MDSRMTREHSLAINTPDGLVVIVGCSHPGIVEIIRGFRDTLGRDVYAVLGGFHLMNDSEEEVRGVIDEMKRLGVKRCGASHCTGERQIAAIRDAFGDNHIPMGAGRVIRFNQP
jgi:7,8-dihydropterin-6-yl-methyl-4-(beta-D-ribofuranosyl)aminobenzene 5'-phosphate synthase